MSVLRTAAMSDILAATGQAGMEGMDSGKFWNWRRVMLTVGYGLVFVAGLLILFAPDPNGLILMTAAVGGFVFLHRTWLGVVVWAYVLISGVVAITSGDDLGFYGVGAGLVFGVIALPLWSRRQSSPRPAYYWPQSPFMAPPPASPPTAIPAATPDLDGSTAVALSMPATSAEPMIRTIGRLRILTASGDFTSELMRKPVVGFLWLYMLARSVRKPDDRMTRTAITDEVAHGVRDPRQRLRGYLLDISRLPDPLGSMVKVEDELIGFDLGEVEADFIQLRTLAQRIRETKGSLDDDLLREAQALLSEIGDGEFLPGFEDMDKRVTKGRGNAGQVVAEVRAQIDTMRADVAVAIGEALLDRGEPAVVVALLDPIVKRAEDRDDVARTLSAALRELGQHDRAAEIRRRNVLGQEG